VLSRKFIAISTYILEREREREREREISNKLIMQLKLLEKQKQTKPITSSQRE
jgi:hypothetical protein